MSTADFRIVRCRPPGVHAVVANSRRAFARHAHEEFGIGVIERGGQLSHSARGQVEAGPGDVITVNPGEVHDGAPVGDRPRAWRILYFRPDVVAQAAADVFEGAEGSFELSRPVLTHDRAGGLLRQLFEAVTGAQDNLLQEGLLLATLAAVGVDRRPAPVRAGRSEVSRARALVDDDPAADFSLSDLSAVSGLGRFQLIRAFKRVTGLPPHAYVLQRRVELARRLIASGLRLADAAAASGFSDQSHMTRAFVSRYGLTPGAWASAASG